MYISEYFVSELNKSILYLISKEAASVAINCAMLCCICTNAARHQCLSFSQCCDIVNESELYIGVAVYIIRESSSSGASSLVR